MKVRQELMRHANIQTTMRVYGSAMLESKRTANSKIVRMVLVPPIKREKWTGPRARGPLTFPIVPPLSGAVARNLLNLLVAGVDLNHRPLGYEFNGKLILNNLHAHG